MRKATPRDFARPEIVGAALVVVAARAAAKVERARMDEIETQLLAEHPLYTSAKWEKHGMKRSRITKPSEVYLADQDDWGPHYARKHEVLARLGYVIDADKCPALVAEATAIDAETALIRLTATLPGCEKVTPSSLLCLGLDERNEFVELVLKLAIGQGVKRA